MIGLILLWLLLYSYCLVGLFLPLRSEKWTTRGRGWGSWGRAAGTNPSHHKPLGLQHHLLHELFSGGHHHRHHTSNRHRDGPGVRVPRGDASESPEVRRSLLVTVCSSLLYLYTNTSFRCSQTNVLKLPDHHTGSNPPSSDSPGVVFTHVSIGWSRPPAESYLPWLPT